MPVDREQIEQLGELMRRYCIQHGDFTLASGRSSKYYYNGKRVTLRPSAAKLIGEALVDVALAAGAEAVGGPALGAVPIATAVGMASLTRERELPVFVVRMEQKAYGARDLIAQPYASTELGEVADDAEELMAAGRPVAMVEDAITTGGSAQKAIEAVEAVGCKVVLVAVLLERHEGGGDALRERGYDVLSIFRTDEEGQLSVNEEFLRRLQAAQVAAPAG